MWWYIPVIPAMWEAEIRESPSSKPAQAKSSRTYPKNNKSIKVLGV
jgi:hypothetical protein